jgi:predicted transcriptional regulator
MKRPSYRQFTRRHGQGIDRLLGELEVDIMEVLWREEASAPMTVRDVLTRLNAERAAPVAYTTVMTVMARLVEKGLLTRTLVGHTHEYQVVQSRDEFLRRASQQIVQDLVADFGEVAIASFVEAIERVDPARLQQLRAYLTAEERER